MASKQVVAHPQLTLPETRVANWNISIQNFRNFGLLESLLGLKIEFGI